MQRRTRLAEHGDAVLVEGHWDAGIGVVEDVSATGRKAIVYFPLIEIRGPVLQSRLEVLSRPEDRALLRRPISSCRMAGGRHVGFVLVECFIFGTAVGAERMFPDAPAWVFFAFAAACGIAAVPWLLP